MMKRALTPVLWAHTIITGFAGVLFFLWPAESATLWPWPLPALAARFMGSLFIAGAGCSLVCLRYARGLFVMILLAAGDTLIALAGLFAVAELGLTPAMIVFLAFYLGVALLLVVALLPGVGSGATVDTNTVPSALRLFFLVHLIVVLPVGITMFFLPQWAQSLWPWRMTPINVRFLGAFFLGAALISIWALRQRSPEPLLPVLVLYALFATLATIASLIHIRLFDTARVATWAFFALYVFVAAGSALSLWRLVRTRSRSVRAASS
jgi:hypothetical protein